MVLVKRSKVRIRGIKGSLKEGKETLFFTKRSWKKKKKKTREEREKKGFQARKSLSS